LRRSLEARPFGARTKAQYEAVARAFRAAYLADPAYREAPASLALAAHIYTEMGHRFRDAGAFGEAIQTYQVLIASYPSSSLARHALLTIGEIYRYDLGNQPAARKVFARFIQKYPQSSEAQAARNNLNQMNATLAQKQIATPASFLRPPVPQSFDGLAEVTDIHDWVGTNYMRVVIGVQHRVDYDTFRLTHPDRIVFDLHHAELSPALKVRVFPAENGFLRQIRVGQFKPTVTRVVLNVRKLDDYTVFPLPNPFRLVVDIHGPQAPRNAPRQEEMAKSSPPTRKEAPPSVERLSEGRKAAQHPPVAGIETHSGKETPSASAAPETTKPPPTEAASLHRPPSTRNPERAIPEVLVRPPAPITGTPTLVQALGLKVARIVIDPGHGGHDTGAIGPGGIEEKNIVLDVALRLRRLLEEKTGAQVFMTRTTDKFVPLEERTAIANRDDADLFISIHANASRDPDVRGIETYYLNFTTDPEALRVAARENATSQESVHELSDLIRKIALNEKVQESQQFATDVQDAMVHHMDRIGDPEPNRGVKRAPFVVLIGADMPSILCEISFLTDPKDAHLLRERAYLDQIAEGIYRGVVKYMRSLGTMTIAEQDRHTDPPHHPHPHVPASRRKEQPKKF
jgi:N-acetylmuramoyl-L-alanine amidase